MQTDKKPFWKKWVPFSAPCATSMVLMLLTCAFCLSSAFAQSPDKMSYQAVVRNEGNQLVASAAVGLKISILQGSVSGTPVYVEIYNPNPVTNANGLVTVEIGGGIPVSGTFGSIDWAKGPYFIKTEIDPTGRTNYTVTGTSQLLSVPFAFNARSAETVNGATAVGNNLLRLANPAVVSFLRLNADSSVSTLDPAGFRTAIDAAAGNHAHGNLTSDGKIGVAEGRIVTTAAGGNLQATSGMAAGEMLYWNGSAWVNVAPGATGQVLTFLNGVPRWTGASVSSTDVINPSTGKIWMDRNLGATRVATSSTDTNAYGFLYQWGRDTDGHQKRTSATTTTLSTRNNPGHAYFILSPSSPYDWLSPSNDNLWQGFGVNNPCPVGYRLPNLAEWVAEALSWSSKNAAGAFASPLKLPVAGVRSYKDGLLANVGSEGYYWSSTVDIVDGVRFLYF